MSMPIERTAPSRRAALDQARQSRRPSRLGVRAGTLVTPDWVLPADAGFPGLLSRAWQQAAAALSLAAAVDTLLTLDGHVPAQVQLRALRLDEECALKALFGVGWRDGGVDTCRPYHDPGGQVAFVGEIGLTTGGRVAVRVPSQGLLANEVTLVDGVIRVPWSVSALARYRSERKRLLTRSHASVLDCREWLAGLGAADRDDLLDQLKEAALRTAPFVLYQDRKVYTNFRERNTLTGKTLWPGHPDCALSSLQGIPLELWSDSDTVVVVSLALLIRSAGFGRIEEANGTQLTVEHIADLLEYKRRMYNAAGGPAPVPPADGIRVSALAELAERLRQRRAELARSVQLYRQIHGPLMYKTERVADRPGAGCLRREQVLCSRLRAALPVRGGTLAELTAGLATSPRWLTRPHGGFGSGLESLVYQTVAAARVAFEVDFAMSRGMRSLPRLIRALREENWAEITGWDLPDFFCCVVPSPEAQRFFDDSPARLADIAWSIAARMQYNSWHFIAGNLPRVPEVMARDYFVPPTIPDIAHYSDQHHRGHVAARVRFSIRSPQPVEIAGRTFAGFVDLRLLRCEGPPLVEQDLLAAHRASAFVAAATRLVADLVAAGEQVEVTAFDPAWHWAAIAMAQPEVPGRTGETQADRSDTDPV
jgi:hypothetical protein